LLPLLPSRGLRPIISRTPQALILIPAFFNMFYSFSLSDINTCNFQLCFFGSLFFMSTYKQYNIHVLLF
jgi:hypothetical protein